MSKTKAQLLLKVPGFPAKEVRTSFPVTLYDKVTDKMIGYTDTNTTAIIESHSKNRIVQGWNGWRIDNYEVVWDGAQKKGFTKSKLPDQKGLLMGDYSGGSATKQIMEHMEMLDVDDTKVDSTKQSKKKKNVK
jgi:hypothetical protein